MSLRESYRCKKRQVKHYDLWEIHSETFTSLIEFVKNHLVKREFLCHHQKTFLGYLNGPKILGYVNQTAKYAVDKAQFETDIITANKTITTFSNSIQLQLNNE